MLHFSDGKLILHSSPPNTEAKFRLSEGLGRLPCLLSEQSPVLHPNAMRLNCLSSLLLANHPGRWVQGASWMRPRQKRLDVLGNLLQLQRVPLKPCPKSRFWGGGG